MDAKIASPVVDCLQYANWSADVFAQMRAGGVHGVHATIAYHENFRETVANIIAWNRHFERHPDLIFPGRVPAATSSGRCGRDARPSSSACRTRRRSRTTSA
jgi:hypothetical protein